MKYNWKETTIGECTTILGDGLHGTPKYNENGNYFFINGNNLVNGKIIIKKDTKKVDETQFKKYKKDLNDRTILISINGTLGNVGLYNGENVILGKSACYFNVKSDIEKNYIKYIVMSPDFQNYLKNNATGTTIKNISLKQMREYSFYLPSLPTQHRIASILSALDDKIELNNKINENLEMQAQAIFKSWFVDFEPFGGVMPEDWKIGTVKDIVELHDSKRIPLSGSEREKMDKIYPYYGATSCMDYVDNYIFDGIYLLLGEDGTVVDTKGFPILQYVEGKFWVNNHAHILTGKLGYTVETLYLLFKQTNVTHIVTGAVQPKISQANLKKLPAIIPNIKELDNFNTIIQPIFSMIRKNKNENQRLSELRDTLLPKLMNGEIDVDDVQVKE